MLRAHSLGVRREDSAKLEARLLARDRDQAVIGGRVFEANPFLLEGSSEDAEPVVQEETVELPLLQDEQANGQSASQDGSGDDLFDVLGAALDEIEAEEREETKELMAPRKDVAEILPALDTMYRKMTRTFICSQDPKLARAREKVRPGQLVTAVDKNLEDLLTISLTRARTALEQRRAVNVRTTRWAG